MKLIINTCYGGFGINKKWEAENCEKDCNEDCRECAKLIRAIEERENVDDDFYGMWGDCEPDDYTDDN